MTLQITKAEGFWNDRTSSYNSWHLLLELAKALSAHPGWNIIDSYMPGASPERLNGDPISGGLWGGLDKWVNPKNAWFVVEQANPTGGRPAMQAKFQQNGSVTGFDDPSGNDYGYEGTVRIFCARFAPFGGWDLDPSTPDFANPTTKVTPNMQVMQDNGSNNGHWYFSIDDDFFMYFMFDTSANSWLSIGFYIGEYTPMFAGQDTPDHPAYLYLGSDGDYPNVTQYDGLAGISSEIVSERASYNAPRLYLPDENGDLKVWRAWSPPMNNGFINGTIVPNEFDPIVGIDLIEIIFMGLEIAGSPDTRMIGSLKHIWRGWGIGNGGFIGTKQYLTLGSNIACAIIEWDGVTSL